MWGDGKLLRVDSVAGLTGPTPFASSQIVRIAYARPETWRWFFSSTIINGNVAAGASLVVVYKATFGVGRSQNTVNLARFVFTWPGNTPIGAQKFTNNVNGPAHDDGDPTAPNVVNTIVAQDIQLQVEAQLLSAVAADNVEVDIEAFFSPQTHIRPEWYRMREPDAQSPGGETGGR
jgi:hypothetical protein